MIFDKNSDFFFFFFFLFSPFILFIFFFICGGFCDFLIFLCAFAAAVAAKSLQSCPTPCDPTDSSPQGSPVPGILQARHWSGLPFPSGMHEKWRVKAKTLSRVRFLATPWTAAHQAPPSMGFSRQEYWSGVPLPSPLMCYYMLTKFFIPVLTEDSWFLISAFAFHLLKHSLGWGIWENMTSYTF